MTKTLKEEWAGREREGGRERKKRGRDMEWKKRNKGSVCVCVRLKSE